MVCDDHNLVIGSFEESSPFLETVDYREEFFIVCVIVYFGWSKFSGMERYRVLFLSLALR